MLKVGDTVYEFNINNRSNIEHFREVTITGETKSCFIIDNGAYQFNKKTMIQSPKIRTCNRHYYTKQGMEDSIWIKHNRYNLSEKVLRCNNIQILKQIQELLDDKK